MMNFTQIGRFKKKRPGSLGYMSGMRSYPFNGGDYFVSHEIRIPVIQQPGFHGKYRAVCGNRKDSMGFISIHDFLGSGVLGVLGVLGSCGDEITKHSRYQKWRNPHRGKPTPKIALKCSVSSVPPF